MIFNGRKEINIPISKKVFDTLTMKQVLSRFLPIINKTHNQNCEDYKKLHNIFLGQQRISKKKRENNSTINNIITENHLNKIVNFKVGFMYGQPLDYSIAKNIETDDLTFLNIYITDCNKPSLDIEKAQDLYEFGISHMLILPKNTNLINDINSDAPFTLDRLPNKDVCIVYSSDIPSVKLFGIVFGENYDFEKNESEKSYQIFAPNRRYLYIEDKENNLREVENIPQSYNFIPIVEFKLNNYRMGVLELGIPLQDLINSINSSQIDDIEENVNSYMVIKNQLIDEEWKKTFEECKKQRIISLTTNNPETPPSIELLKSDLNQEAINIFYERVVKALYDISSVPQSSGNVTSGGDTGQARLLGNGWESAQNQATVEQTYLIQFERELLKDMINICKNYPDNPINTISASYVNIKFNINMRDNLLVKTQSLTYLHKINFPLKSSLAICGLTNDVDGVGNAWEEREKEITEREIETENAIKSTTEEKKDSNNLENISNDL